MCYVPIASASTTSTPRPSAENLTQSQRIIYLLLSHENLLFDKHNAIQFLIYRKYLRSIPINHNNIG